MSTQPIIFGQFLFGPNSDQSPPDLTDPATRLSFDSRMAAFYRDPDLTPPERVDAIKTMARMWRGALAGGI